MCKRTLHQWALRLLPTITGIAVLTGALLFASDFGGLSNRTAEAVPPDPAFELRKSDTIINVICKGDARTIDSCFLREWVTDAANSVSTYYGRLGVKRLQIEITATNGSGVGFASTSYSDEGCGIIEAFVGLKTTREQFKRDWTLTHEMTHLSFPLMDHEHRWLAEGIATYVEPISRVRNHLMSEDQMWRELIHGAARGQPHDGEGGLNGSQTFNRWYWGGAIYCLLADVEMRKRSANTRGLEDALKGIVDQGGNIASEWEPDETLRAGDKAVGLNVMTELFASMAFKPVRADLDSLWKQLGVELTRDGVAYNDGAPLASIRKKIVRGGSYPLSTELWNEPQT